MPATTKAVKGVLLALALSMVGLVIALVLTNPVWLPGGDHHGSPAYYGKNVSFLEPNSDGLRDSVLTVCDRTANGNPADARAWNRESNDFTLRVRASYGDCNTIRSSRNHEFHQTGDADINRWGDRSYHTQ